MPENPDLKQWRKTRGLLQSDLAALLPVNLNTVQNWESVARASPPPPFLWRALRDLDRELKIIKVKK